MMPPERILARRMSDAARAERQRARQRDGQPARPHDERDTRERILDALGTEWRRGTQIAHAVGRHYNTVLRHLAEMHEAGQVERRVTGPVRRAYEYRARQEAAGEAEHGQG